MDFFAHGFWSFLLFHRQRWKYWAIFFGMLPDISSWFIFSIYNMITNSVQWGAGHPDFSGVPNWTWTLYGLSHSVIVFMVVFALLYLIFRKIKWVIFPWLVHILLDIPTHSREFLPTPFLWPISTWHFPGFSWGQRWFMILNYSLLALGYTYFFIYIPWQEKKIVSAMTTLKKPKARKRKTQRKRTSPRKKVKKKKR
jgi:hypothetical protein